MPLHLQSRSLQNLIFEFVTLYVVYMYFDITCSNLVRTSVYPLSLMIVGLIFLQPVSSSVDDIPYPHIYIYIYIYICFLNHYVRTSECVVENYLCYDVSYGHQNCHGETSIEI